MKLLFPFKNRNFLALFILHFVTITYGFLCAAYFSFKKDLYVDGGNYGSDSVIIVFIALATTLALCVGLFFISITRIRSWVVFVAHGLFVLLTIGFFAFIAPGFDPSGLFMYGLLYGVLFYLIFFGPATWFLFRFRNTFVPICANSLFFIGTALLANERYKDTDNLLSLIRFDILVILIIFFILISLILYFENLLKFARELNKPAVPVKKGYFGILIVTILILIPTILALVIGVQRIKFHQKKIDDQKVAEELEKKQQELKQKQKELEKEKRKQQQPSEKDKLEDPYGNPFSISPENQFLFEATLDKEFYDQYLPLRAVSYSVWDDEKEEYVADRASEQILAVDGKLFSIDQETEKNNKLLDFNSKYFFTEAFNYKVVPHLQTAVETTEQLLFYKQGDYILSEIELNKISDLEIKSKSLNTYEEWYFDPKATLTTVIKNNYLSYPDDQEVRDLVKEILGGDNSIIYENKIDKIFNYITENYYYDPEFETVTTKKTISYKDFLFNSQSGSSLNFAEALTILLRAEGIPSRLVTGYVAETEKTNKTIFQYNESNKLFWVEVYYPGAGWVDYYPIGSEQEKEALEEKAQDQKEEEEKSDFEDLYGENGKGGEFEPLTKEEIEKLPQDLKEKYEEILEDQEKLEQKQEEKKKNEENRSQWIGAFIKLIMIIIGIVLGILIFTYLFIYPVIRFFLVKNKTSKESDPYKEIIITYKLIISIYKWFGAKITREMSPTEIIKEIEKTYGVNLHGIEWIYNRAVLREKLEESDLENTRKAFGDAWYDRFDKNFGIKSLMYFYRIGRIVK